MVRLGDVCEVVLGGTPKTGITEYWDGDIPWLTPGDMGKITQMYVDASNCKRKISQLGLDNGSTLCPARSVILSTRAPIGYAFVNSVPMATNQGCKTLVPSDDVYPEYLCFNLLGRTDELNELGTGTTFKELATGRLKAMTLPLPPLSVQREIVARLERELAAVEKMKKGFEALAETARAEFKAELKEVFEEISRGGAETRRLGEVCEKIGSGATPLGGKKTYIENGTSLIRSQNVIDFSFSFLGLAHISETQAAQLDSVSVFDGDVLVNITGDSVARVCIVDNRCLPARVNQHVAIIRLSHSANVLNRYLEACLVAMKDELLKESVKGSTRKALTKDYLINLEIPVPPLSAQREVVARLDSAKARAEKLEAKAREGAAVCETMRKAILKEAFE